MASTHSKGHAFVPMIGSKFSIESSMKGDGITNPDIVSTVWLKRISNAKP